MQTYNTYLIEKKTLNTDVVLLRYQLDLLAHLDFKSGQYIMLQVPTADNSFVNRLFSIASANTQTNALELIVEYIPNGVASEYIKKSQLNDHITFRGPGGMFLLKPNEKEKVFLATGTGIAPIRSMLHELLETHPVTSAIHLFWGMRTYAEVYIFDELKRFAEFHPNFHLHICLSREENLLTIPEADRHYFSLGRITKGCDDIIMSTVKDTFHDLNDKYDFYLCGGRAVVESLRQYLQEKSVTPENVVFEKF